jgi:hypothetical protein
MSGMRHSPAGGLSAMLVAKRRAVQQRGQARFQMVGGISQDATIFKFALADGGRRELNHYVRKENHVNLNPNSEVASD